MRIKIPGQKQNLPTYNIIIILYTNSVIACECYFGSYTLSFTEYNNTSVISIEKERLSEDNHSNCGWLCHPALSSKNVATIININIDILVHLSIVYSHDFQFACAIV